MNGTLGFSCTLRVTKDGYAEVRVPVEKVCLYRHPFVLFLACGGVDLGQIEMVRQVGP